MFNEKEKAELRALKDAYASLPFYKKLWLHLCSWRLARALANIHPDTTSASNVIELFELYAHAWFLNTAYGILSHFGLTDVFQSSITIDQTTEKYASFSSWGYARNEKESVLNNVLKNGLALQFASDDLKNNEEIVMAAVNQNGLALQFASDDFKNNKEIVMTAVNQNGLALQFASDDFKNNKEIVMAAVNQNGLALQFAADEFRRDRIVVTESIKNNVGACAWADIQLRRTFEFCMEASKINHEVLGYLPLLLMTNHHQIIESAVEQSCQNDGRFVMTTRAADLQNETLSLFEQYPVRQLTFSKELLKNDYLDCFINTLSHFPYEYWRKTSLVKFTLGVPNNQQLPQYFVKALAENEHEQQSCVVSLAQGLFAANKKSNERARVSQDYFPYDVVITIMRFLPYFFASSGYRTEDQLFRRNSCANEENIDCLIPAMSLFWAATSLMMKNRNDRAETGAESRIEVLPDDEASLRPSAEPEYTPR